MSVKAETEPLHVCIAKREWGTAQARSLEGSLSLQAVSWASSAAAELAFGAQLILVTHLPTSHEDADLMPKFWCPL